MKSPNFRLPEQQEDQEGMVVEIENDLPLFMAVTDVVRNHSHLSRATIMSTLLMTLAGVALYDERNAEFVESVFTHYCALGKEAIKQ